MVALPNPTAVIFPFASTAATLVSLEPQVTVLSVAFSGKTVAVKVLVSPTAKVALIGAILILSTWIGSTITVHVAVNPPAVIFLFFSTAATLVSLEPQVTVLLVAFSGKTVAVKVSLSSTAKVIEVLFNETLVTRIISGFSDPQLQLIDTTGIVLIAEIPSVGIKIDFNNLILCIFNNYINISITNVRFLIFAYFIWLQYKLIKIIVSNHYCY